MRNTKKVLKRLELNDEFSDSVETYLNYVSYYRLVPYINFVSENPHVVQTIIQKNNQIKNKLETVVYLYRYNIKLSISLYPYLFLLETSLKTKINNLMCDTYSDNWFKDEDLFFQAHSLNEPIDRELFNEAYNYPNIGSLQKEEIKNAYKKYNSQLKLLNGDILSNKQINDKVFHITSCVYQIKTVREELEKNKNINCIDFVENKATFGYWLSLLRSKYFWNKGEVQLMNIFSKGFDSLTTLKENHTKIIDKLDRVRILSNKISHHGQIIGNKTFRKFSLIDVYGDILYLFKLLKLCPNDDLSINELKCNNNRHCDGRSFTVLYNELNEIHDFEIKPGEINFFIDKTIKRIIVKSSDLKSVGFDLDNKILEIEFQTGSIYRYANVLEEEYKTLMNSAPNYSEYFNKNIRYSYNYKKIKDKNL